MVIINRNERNRAIWKLGIVEKLAGKNGVVRAQPAITCSKLAIETLEQRVNMFKINNKDTRTTPVQLRNGKSYFERAVQHRYPLELQCDRKDNPVSVEARSYKADTTSRSKRTASVIADIAIKDQDKWGRAECREFTRTILLEFIRPSSIVEYYRLSLKRTL